MASDKSGDVDAATGISTTGHEWDGIRELNNPLPRWWLWIFYATIVWSVGYWIVYPAWPLMTDATRGVLNWNTRTAIVEDMAALRAARALHADRIAAAAPHEIVADPALLSFARAQGRVAFADNCAPCHGAGGGGSRGYPNLIDDEWLWGGTLDNISQTIRHGIRAGDAKGRQGSMPAFGRDGILQRPDVVAVAEYARSLAGLPTAQNADLARGRQVFAENCAVCHGETGKGNRELGAPNLTNAIWLNGSDLASVIEGVWNGRGAVMPAFGSRLDDTTIKALTVYVHTLGGGEK